MCELPCKHPDVHTYKILQRFVCSSQDKDMLSFHSAGSCPWTCKCWGKRREGVVGLAKNPAVLKRWTLAGPESTWRMSSIWLLLTLCRMCQRFERKSSNSKTLLRSDSLREENLLQIPWWKTNNEKIISKDKGEVKIWWRTVPFF